MSFHCLINPSLAPSRRQHCRQGVWARLWAKAQRAQVPASTALSQFLALDAEAGALIYRFEGTAPFRSAAIATVAQLCAAQPPGVELRDGVASVGAGVPGQAIARRRCGAFEAV